MGLYDFSQMYDRLEVTLEQTLAKNVKQTKRLEIRKGQLQDAEDELAEKKAKLQKLHKETGFEGDVRSSVRGSMMGSMASVGSFDQRASFEGQRSSFRASMEGIRASLDQ